MAKFSIEMDTTTKTYAMKKDGVDVPHNSCSFGSYKYKGEGNKTVGYCYASYSQQLDDSTYRSINVAFCPELEDDMEDCDANISISAEASKIVKRVIAAKKIEQNMKKSDSKCKDKK